MELVTPKARWNAEYRTFLCCMYKFFQKDLRAFRDIFNARFKDDLHQMGVVNGISTGAINSQWHTMSRQGDPVWGDVHLSRFDREPWLPVLEVIERTAVDPDLAIFRKTSDDIDTSGFEYRNVPQHQLQPSQVLSPLQEPKQDLPDTPTYDPEREEAIEPPPPSFSSLSTAGDKVCFWCHLEGKDCGPASMGSLEPDHIPPLLYRWWNVDSQGVNSSSLFVAGLFASASTGYFSPGDIPSEEFNRRFRRHIEVTSTHSPFISTSKSMLAPVHRSLHNQEGATISIIDSRKLKTSIFSAQEFVQKHGIKIGPTYKGVGEYLIWGKIDPAAIICSFKVSTLSRMAAEQTDIGKLLQLNKIGAYKKARRPLHRALIKDSIKLDKNAGAAVGRLLSMLQVPHIYIKGVSEGIAYSWRIMRKPRKWGDYFEGVEGGYTGQLRSPTIPSLANSESDDDGDDYELISSESDDDFSFCDEDYDNDDNAEGDEGEEISTNEDARRAASLPDPDWRAVLVNRQNIVTSNVNSLSTAETSRQAPNRMIAPIAPLIELDDSGHAALDPRNIPIVVEDSSDSEMDDADGFESNEEAPHQGRTARSHVHDVFANDRARVMSALQRST